MKHILKFSIVPLCTVQIGLLGMPVLAQSGMETLEDFDYWQNLCQRQYQAGDAEKALPACEQAIALEPKDDTIWADYSAALLTLGQYPETLAATDRLLSFNQQSSAAMAYQCLAYQGLNMPEAALDSCNAALQTDSYWGNLSPTLVWRTQGQLLDQLNQPEQALIAYERGLGLEPADALTLTARCQTLVESGEYDYGIEACDAALTDEIRLSGNPAMALTYKGQALIAQEKYKEAIEAYDEAIALEPENPEHWLQQGWLLAKTDNFTGAVLAYTRAVELQPDSSRGLVGQCDAFNQQGQYEQALPACEQAIAGNGDWWDLGPAQAWHGMAKAMAGQGNYESALAAIERAVAIDNDYLAALSDQSVILWYMDDYDTAITIANQVIESGSTADDRSVVANTWANLGRIHSSRQNYGAAISAYYEAINHGHKTAATWSNLSAALWANKNYGEAISAAAAAISLDPQSEQGWHNQAAAQAALGYYEQAQISYETARDINNQNAAVWAGLGVVQLRLDQTDAAIESLETAIQLDPHQALAQTILDTLEESL